MTDWMNSIFGGTVPQPLSYVVLLAIVILAILLLLWIAKKLLGGTFVSGGRGRHLRLAVMDATPVDSRRRLVLVRRDDVEHLILIGGPTDVVVEQNIRLDGKNETKSAVMPRLAAEPEPDRPVETPRSREAPNPVQHQPAPAGTCGCAIPAAPAGHAPTTAADNAICRRLDANPCTRTTDAGSKAGVSARGANPAGTNSGSCAGFGRIRGWGDSGDIRHSCQTAGNPQADR